MKKILKWFLWVIAALVIGVVILIAVSVFISVSNRGYSPNGGASGGTSISKSKEDKVEDNYPDQERHFIRIVEQSIARSNSATNDMQRGGIKADRTDALCHVLKNKFAGDWIGKVQTVDSNSDGRGVLSIRLARGISVKTWNNALSDILDNTLLIPRTPIFNTASNLKIGDYVIFSGHFIPDVDNCITEASMGLSGGLEEPEFIFKFSDIRLR